MVSAPARLSTPNLRTTLNGLSVFGVTAARKPWLQLTTALNPDGAIRGVCACTGAGNSRQSYLDRARIVGDFHGQAPVVWCVSALLR